MVENERRVWRDMAEYDTSEGVHPRFPPTIFSDIVDSHLARTSNVGGMVGNAHSYLLQARALLEDAQDVMRRMAGESRAKPTPR